MPTYEYETIPQKPGDKPIRFEITQRMADAPLTKHPETGVPVQRVVSGGMGFLCEERGGSAKAPTTGGGGCGRSGCGHSHFH